MKVLAVDTSSNAASVALVEDNILLGEFVLNHKKTHSQEIMPMIDDVLKRCGCEVSDIDLFAAAKGPGSFTGLRIGIATVKGLAHSVNKPVIGIGTLEGLAYNLPFCEHTIVPIMDARRNQVYTGAYMWDGEDFREIGESEAMSIEECVSSCGNFLETVFLGDGVPVYKDFIKEKLGDKAIFAPASCNMQRASSIAMLAQKRKDEAESYYGLEPMYLRKPQAEREREEKLKKEGQEK